MDVRKTFGQIWLKRDSGLVVPEGTVSDLSQTSTETYLQIKEKAIAIERLYKESGVPLKRTSDLARLIGDAKTLSDSWLLGQADRHPQTLLFRVGLLDRIADSVLPLSEIPARGRFLKALVSDNLDLLSRTKSHAKNVLWELELWSALKRRSLDAVLEEPPDIVVRFDASRIGIPCKKLYSEKHVQNVLSEAVAQIESSFDFGIVALNLDELIPADHIFRTPTLDSMAKHIMDLNHRFLVRHDRHFRKYLASGRVISALVSTSLLADAYRERTRFNNARQSTVWTIPGLPFEKNRQLRNFYNALMA